MEQSSTIEKKEPVRLSLGLAMAAVALLLNACSTHQADFSPAGRQQASLHNGLDRETSNRFWAGVRPVSSLAQSHYRLGRFYQKSGKHQEAIEEFIKAVELDESFVPAHNGMGVSYDALRDCDNAEKAYARALHFTPDMAYLHNNLGCSRLLCNDPEQALVHLAKAAALDKNISRIHNNLLLAELRFQQRFPEKQAVIGLTSPVRPPERLETIDREQKQPQAEATAPPGPSLLAAAGAPPSPPTAVSPEHRQPEGDSPAVPTAAAETITSPAAPTVAADTVPETNASPVAPTAAGATAPASIAPATPSVETIEAKTIAPETIAPETIATEIIAAVAPADETPAAAQPVAETITIRSLVPVENNSAPDTAALQTAPRLPLCPIEIANGNGVTGMAGRSARYLRTLGIPITRIINAPHFNHGISIIYYREGNREVAEALAAIVPGPQVIEPEKISGQAGKGVRLLLGKDMAQIRFSEHLARSDNGEMRQTNLKALVAG
jgi:Tfp pilus assembly protein PilF